MRNENSKPILVTLTDGAVVKGDCNIRQYTMQGRLSDVFNHPGSHFLVLTDVTFLRNPHEVEEMLKELPTLFINKQQIVTAMPLD